MKTEAPKPRGKAKLREVAVPGIAVSPGIAIGPVFDTTDPPAEAPRRAIAADAVDDEKQKLAGAVAFSRKQIGKLKTRIGVLPEEAQEEIAPLLDAHLMMLGNSRLIRGARKRVEAELLGAETAVADEAEAIIAAILALKGDDKAGIARRAGEVRDIARRLTRFAAEDIGMADPRALPLAIAAWETFERMGSPEGELALAQLVVHLATAPKSNAVYLAFGEAMRAARETGSLMPPKHILNAPTKLMQEIGYGAGYAYDHEAEGGFSGQDYFPEEMGRRVFYRPTDRGAEAAIAERLARFAELRRTRKR